MDERIRRNVQNLLIAVFLAAGALIVWKSNQDVLGRSEAIACFSIALIPLVIFELIAARITGIATLKGISINKESNPKAFSIARALHIMVLIGCLFGVVQWLS